MQPIIVTWNLTARCNLRCPHCYIDAASQAAPGELDSAEALRLVDEIAQVAPGAMLVFSGGEPLLRPDLPQLLRQAADKGLMVLVGSNGTLLTEEVARELVGCGVSGVGLSLDSLHPEYHDAFRGVNGAWQRAVAAMELCRRHQLPFQMQATVTGQNFAELTPLADFAYQAGAAAFNLFFLVCTGRGESLTDVTPQQYEAALTQLAGLYDKYPGMKVAARCAPHFVRLMAERGIPPAELPAGCLAGSRYFRITPEGEVTPCPYLPLTVGNVRQSGLAQIWSQAPLFQKLRQGEWKGRCRMCQFAATCGGCRARAYATTGDYLAEDGWCSYQPSGEKTAVSSPPDLPWQPEARERMERAPAFIRERVAARIEAFARERGYPEVTVQVLEEAKGKLMGGKHPFPLPWHRPHH